MCTVMSLESSLISLKVMSGCFDFQFAIGSLMDDYLGKCCCLFLEPHINNLCQDSKSNVAPLIKKAY